MCKRCRQMSTTLMENLTEVLNVLSWRLSAIHMNVCNLEESQNNHRGEIQKKHTIPRSTKNSRNPNQKCVQYEYWAYVNYNQY